MDTSSVINEQESIVNGVVTLDKYVIKSLQGLMCTLQRLYHYCQPMANICTVALVFYFYLNLGRSFLQFRPSSAGLLQL